MMIEGVTLPKIAEELQIHISTAFYWRHKILNTLRSLGFTTAQATRQKASDANDVAGCV
jgi:hypothetical protein